MYVCKAKSSDDSYSQGSLFYSQTLRGRRPTWRSTRVRPKAEGDLRAREASLNDVHWPWGCAKMSDTCPCSD